MAQKEATSFHDLDSDLSRLEGLVKQLEDNSLTIDNAISIYTEGMQLAVECRRSLNQLTQRVTEVRQEAMRAIEQLQAEENAQAQMQSSATVASAAGGGMSMAMSQGAAAPTSSQPQFSNQPPQYQHLAPAQQNQMQTQNQGQAPFPPFSGNSHQGYGSQQ